MAQRTEIVLTDDIDGSPANETVSFGIDGVHYEIDLTAGHAAELRVALEPYIAVARKAGGPPRRAASAARPARHDQSDVRTWARENGLQISGRGRIPAEVIARYEAAH
jgi:Lsr2